MTDTSAPIIRPKDKHSGYGIRLAQGMAIAPGDNILICLNWQPGPEEAKHFVEQLHERFPNVEFTIACGITGIAKGDDDSDD